MWKEAVVAYFDVLSQHLIGQTEEKREIQPYVFPFKFHDFICGAVLK
jgi:hypothetical protein